tara:strand:- start:3113 stop:3820 length:708 start_codon:yes stop_codon:yes gene_type:complete
MKKAIVTLSGGLDSTTIFWDAVNRGYDVFPIYFNYGQQHHNKESQCAITQSTWGVFETRLRTVSLDFFKDICGCHSALTSDQPIPKIQDILGDAQPITYVPFRNQMILSICCAYAEAIGAKTVMYGAALVDTQAGYWDSSKEFVEKINELVSFNRKNKIKIEAPLIKMSKKQIIERAVELEVDLSQTWTCYEGGEKSCGCCPSCSSRIQGFIEAGIKDPLEYEKTIKWPEGNFQL